MKRYSLLFGLLLTAVIACRPTDENDLNGAGTIVAITPVITQQETTVVPVPNTPEPTSNPNLLAPTAPLLPTPIATAVQSPTPDLTHSWVRVGNELTGIQFAAPPEWRNFAAELDVATATNQLGLTTLFLTDNERTGISLLAGKEIEMGAFALGLVSNTPLVSIDSNENLADLLNQMGISPMTEISPVSANTAATTVTGVTADFMGDPVGFPLVAGQSFHMRLFIFPLQNNDGAPLPNTQAVVLMGATADDWPSFEDTFSQMTQTLVIHRGQSEIVINDGAANIVGELVSGDLVRSTLNSGIQDVWAFSAPNGRYATITLSSDNNDLDLQLRIIDSNGQTIQVVDNGYTGDTEIAADILLHTDGRYFVEVDEFFSQNGRYTLNLTITDQPIYQTGGQIQIGQTIESILGNSQDSWTFNGVAGEIVSIVLLPEDDQFDAILNLYGPDGTRLVALDEGFSGDAEVISGYELPIVGQYAIVVRSFAEEGGSYSLSLDEGGEETANFHDAGDIAYGEIKEETLHDNEAHAWFFDGLAGDEVAIKVIPLDEKLDIDLWFLDGNVNRLAVQDNYLAGDAETIEWILPSDGQYIVLVRDFFGEDGRYQIELDGTTDDPPNYAGMLAYGTPITKTLAAGESEVWQFDGQEGESIRIDLSPLDNIDFLFILQNPDGDKVLQVDAASLGNEESFNGFVLTADGLWGVVVKTFFNDGGTYVVEIQRAQ